MIISQKCDFLLKKKKKLKFIDEYFKNTVF